MKLRVRDMCHRDRVASRAIVLQQKTQRPVQFEITPQKREAIEAWIKRAGYCNKRPLRSAPAPFFRRALSDPEPSVEFPNCGHSLLW